MSLEDNKELDTLLHLFVDRPEPDTWRALHAFIQSRERKAWEVAKLWDSGSVSLLDFDDYLASPDYLSTSQESLSTKEGGIVNE